MLKGYAAIREKLRDIVNEAGWYGGDTSPYHARRCAELVRKIDRTRDLQDLQNLFNRDRYFQRYFKEDVESIAPGIILGSKFQDRLKSQKLPKGVKYV